MKRIALFVVLSLIAAGWAAADSQNRVTIAPSTETSAQLLHGLTLEAARDAVPVLIKVDGVGEFFVGRAHLQRPGCAVIKVVQFGTVNVDGYAISAKSRTSCLPVKCLRTSEPAERSECIVGDIPPGEKVSVVFPGGVDIVEWKPFGK